jgi:DNA-binding NtrC family response regulator
MRPRSILIVDDELLIRDLLYDFFTDRDWHVSVCDSAEKAMELIKNRSYEIALIDLKMPEIDGISLIEKIKAYLPDIPVVIMTGFPSLETAIDGIHLKVEDYVIKPFNINKLFKTISAIAEKSVKSTESAKTEDIIT